MVHRFLIARLTASFACINNNTTQIHLGPLLQHNAFLFISSFTSAGTFSESESQTNHHKDHTFTVSYLINSCGLSHDLAVKLSKRVNLKNPERPNAVLDLLKSHGFSETQLSIFVKRWPSVLLSNPDKTLLPKLQFFQSIGVSATDLSKILTANPVLLGRSLRNSIIPRYNILKSVLSNNEETVVAALKRVPWCFAGCGVIDDLVANTEILRQFGVPQASISHMVCNNLRVACLEHSKFVEAVKKVKEMGFDPLKTEFVDAVRVIVNTNKTKWESRLEVYERWGWSKDMSLSAFKRHPLCMLMSENKIMKTMNFLVKDMGWPSEEILRTPRVLNSNLEKTIIPRCTVIKVLKSRGLIKNVSYLSSFIILTEKKFLNKFVAQFQENVPFLLKIYQGHIDHMDIL